MTDGTGPELTVVVASLDADRTLGASLDAILASCVGLQAEIVAVGHRAAEAAPGRPGVRFLPAVPDALVPELWAAGIAAARGRVVALTTGHMVVDRGWARALVAALDGPVGGAGGPLDVMDGTGIVDWAVFYLRYSAFLPSRWKDGPVDGDVAGDNAAYRGEDLRRHAASLDHGFWEVEFDRLIKREGLTLRAVSAARARFGPSYRFGTFLRHRFEHGRQFGAGRRASGERTLFVLIAGAPLVPFMLAFRAARRIGADARHLPRFMLSLPVFLLFAASWAAGEAVGALRGNRRQAAHTR